MPKIRKFQTLEEGIKLLLQEGTAAPLSFGRALRILSDKGLFILLILLSLPFCQPLQIPGFSTPFGLAIAFIGIRLVFGRGIWLPKKLVKKNIPKKVLAKIGNKALLLISKIKPWIHQRLIWLCHSPLMEFANAILIIILGLFLALPLPIPLSNLAAAWSIFFISLGMLEDDGLMVLIGYFISAATAILFIQIVLTLKDFFQ